MRKSKFAQKAFEFWFLGWQWWSFDSYGRIQEANRRRLLRSRELPDWDTPGLRQGHLFPHVDQPENRDCHQPLIATPIFDFNYAILYDLHWKINIYLLHEELCFDCIKLNSYA